MSSIEIKHEFECDSRLQCRSCLSIGRKLAPLGQYTNIFMKLLADRVSPMQLTQPIEICWECESILRKVLLFQQQVKKAYELLQNNQNFTHGPLSNLASITLNDTSHIVYLNEYKIQINPNSVKNNPSPFNNNNADKTTEPSKESNIHKKILHGSDRTRFDNNLKDVNGTIKLNKYVIKNDINDSYTKIHKMDLYVRKEFGPNVVPLVTLTTSIQCDTEDNISCDVNNAKKSKLTKVNNHNYYENMSDKEDNDLENDFDTEIPKLNDTIDLKTIEALSVNKKQRSRWAIKRAAQNKKPKFKVVLANFDDAFTKVQISNEELAKCMAKERDSEFYKSKKYKCETCILGFVEEKEWLKHKERKHCNKRSSYVCDICKTETDDKRHLLAHITQHYNIYKCVLCQFICMHEETRNWHIQNEHKKAFQCLKCGLKFCNRREFYKHYKDWHEKYVCDHCGVSFKMKYCIKEHIRKQHSPFTCVPCKKTFSRYNGLWLHNKLAHSPPTPPAYCVECDTIYKDIYRYKWHLCNSAKHTQKKKLSIPCPECGKTFTKKIYMKDHHNLVHLKLFKYRCEQCDKNFSRNADLVKHRRRKHEGILPPRNKICYLCGRGFTTNKILRNHVRTHERHTHIAAEDKFKDNQIQNK